MDRCFQITLIFQVLGGAGDTRIYFPYLITVEFFRACKEVVDMI